MIDSIELDIHDNQVQKEVADRRTILETIQKQEETKKHWLRLCTNGYIFRYN